MILDLNGLISSIQYEISHYLLPSGNLGSIIFESLTSFIRTHKDS